MARIISHYETLSDQHRLELHMRFAPQVAAYLWKNVCTRSSSNEEDICHVSVQITNMCERNLQSLQALLLARGGVP